MYSKITIKYFKKTFFNNYEIDEREIDLKNVRKFFTNKYLDYTCIELLKSDNIIDFFNIEPNILKNIKIDFENKDIFILQYPKNDLSFSCGKYLALKRHLGDDGNYYKKIAHNTSTEEGSSGSPIILRSINNNIIGIHSAGYGKENETDSFNLGTGFDLILNDIKDQINEIKCKYIANKKEKEINLIHDYNTDIIKFSEEAQNIYLEAKKLNTKIFEGNTELYINDKI